MKHFNFACIFTLVLTLFSCGSDDSSTPEETNSNLIVGKWEITAINDLPDDDCELLGFLDIKADGTYEEQTYGGSGTFCTPDDPSNGTWTLRDNILTLTLDELGNALQLSTDHTILELTATTLEYRFEHDNGDGTTLTEIWTFNK